MDAVGFLPQYGHLSASRPESNVHWPIMGYIGDDRIGMNSLNLWEDSG
jgi:hypothetical protein